MTSGTSPASYVTTYSYADAGTVTAMTSDMIAHDLLHTITDCRGLTTTIQYCMQDQPYSYDLAGYGRCPVVNFVEQPNGTRLTMLDLSTTGPRPTGYWQVTNSPYFAYVDGTGNVLASGRAELYFNATQPQLTVSVDAAPFSVETP